MKQPKNSAHNSPTMPCFRRHGEGPYRLDSATVDTQPPPRRWVHGMAPRSAGSPSRSSKGRHSLPEPHFLPPAVKVAHRRPRVAPASTTRARLRSCLNSTGHTLRSSARRARRGDPLTSAMGRDYQPACDNVKRLFRQCRRHGHTRICAWSEALSALATWRSRAAGTASDTGSAAAVLEEPPHGLHQLGRVARGSDRLAE